VADTLESVLTTEIEKITDPITQQLAYVVLTDYLAARAAFTASSGSDVTSYSVTGRSFTLSGAETLRRRYKELETELAQLIQGSTALIDMSGHEDDES